MRWAALVFSLALPVLPGVALAQSSASGDQGRGGDIKRSDYIEKAVERARHNAEKRFDKMDANHDGVLTADERRAARAARKAAKQAQ